MPTDDQLLSSRRGGNLDGVQAKAVVQKKLVLTVNGNTTVKGQIILPAGADFRSISLDTPVAITGTPTSSLFRAGTTDGGVDIVAAVDAKAAGKIATTIVAALDKAALAALANTTIFYQLITSGGTSSAGPVTVFCDYAAPVF